MKLKWENHVYFEDYIFVAKDIIIPEENRTKLVFNPNNRVGEASTVSFTFTTLVDLKPPSQGAFDKIMIATPNEKKILQNMTKKKKINCAGFDVAVFNE